MSAELKELKVGDEEFEALKQTFSDAFMILWKHNLCNFDGDRFLLFEAIKKRTSELIAKVRASEREDKAALLEEIETFSRKSDYMIDLARALQDDVGEIRERYQQLLKTI